MTDTAKPHKFPPTYIVEVIRRPDYLDKIFTVRAHCECGLHHLYPVLDLNMLDTALSQLKQTTLAHYEAAHEPRICIGEYARG